MRLPYGDPSQPRIIQIGAILFDEKWIVRGELNLILKPDGFTVPVEAAAIHGITTEIAERYGIDRARGLMLISAMMARADILVAHNSDFDTCMLEIESELHIMELTMPPAFCTMRAMTSICQLPNPNGYSDYKWPRLEEAYRHAFGETFDGAHDAMADVRACARIYRWLMEQKENQGVSNQRSAA